MLTRGWSRFSATSDDSGSSENDVTGDKSVSSSGVSAEAQASPGAIPEAERGRIAWVQLIISLVGFLVAADALYEKLEIIKGNAGQLSCDINEKWNCTNVIGSEYGELFGIPLGALGMSFWAIAMGVSLFPLVTPVTQRWAAAWRLFVSSAGLLTAIGLFLIVTFILPSKCMVCAITQAVCVAYFVTALVSFVRLPKTPLRGTFTAFIRLALVTILVGVFPVILSFILTHIANAGNNETPMSAATNTSSGAAGEMQIDPVYKQNGNHSKGNPNAKIQLMMFTDYECPYCQRFHFRIPAIVEAVGPENIHVIFRNWPLSYHKYSKKLALAARCAGRQGKFWEYADWAFEVAMTGGGNHSLALDQAFSQAGLVRKGEELGLNRDEFANCLYSQAEAAKIDDDAKQAQALGGTGTPYILLNGEPLKTNWMVPGELERELKKLID